MISKTPALKGYLAIVLVFVGIVVASALFVQSKGLTATYTPKVLRIGLLPDESEASIRARVSPLLDYLSDETDLDVELILPESYDALVRGVANDEMDLAYFGGLTFVQSHNLHDVEPLVMRDVDTYFTSYFFTHHDADGSDIKAFQNKAISFGSRLSTSGHLMPRHFLDSEHKIYPEDFFSEVHYSGAHDKTVYWVRDKKVDLGVANSEIIRRMKADGRLNENDIRIIWVSPPYHDYVWGVNQRLDLQLKRQLRDAFLGLDSARSEHEIILGKLGAGSFLPAGVEDYDNLYAIAKKLNLLEIVPP